MVGAKMPRPTAAAAATTTTAENTRPPRCVGGSGSNSCDRVGEGAGGGGSSQPQRQVRLQSPPITTTPHHLPITMQHSSSFPSSIESSLAFRSHRLGIVDNGAGEYVDMNADNDDDDDDDDDDDEDDDDDSLAFRTRLDIANYPPQLSSSSIPDATTNNHTYGIAGIGVVVDNGDDMNQGLITPMRERLNTTDTSATVPWFNTSSMLLKNNKNAMMMMSQYEEDNRCTPSASSRTLPRAIYDDFNNNSLDDIHDPSKMTSTTTSSSSDFPESFAENYFVGEGRTSMTPFQPSNETTQTFRSTPQCREGGTLEQRKGSFYDDTDDIASDVSSLTDALSFHLEDKKKEKKTHAPIKDEQEEVVVDRRHQFARRRSRSAGGAAGLTCAADASPVRNASPSSTNRVSSMAAALLRKPKVLQRVRSLRLPDSTDAAATSNNSRHSLEGFDHSLEQQLYMDGSKRGIVEHIVGREQLDNQQQQSQQHLPLAHSPRPPVVGRGRTIYQSPLGEAIDREKISSFSRKIASSSSQTSRSSSSSTTRSQRRSHGGAASGSGKSQSSSSRRHHSPVPGDEGRAFASARRHRRTTSDGNRASSRGIESLWVTTTSTSLQPSLVARASTDASIQNSWLTTSPTPPARIMGAGVTQRRRRYSNIPIEVTRPNNTGKSSLQPDEDLIDVTYDEPVDPFSGLIGMPQSIIGCSDDVFGAPTITSSCSTEGGDNSSSIQSSSSPVPPGGGTYSGRPPSGKRMPKRAIVVETFDPLLEGEGCGNDGIEATSFSILSPRAAATPPRHYKDDPLLANSRYRQPMMMRSPTEGQSHQQHQRPSLLTHRSMSLGSGLNVNPSIGGNSCILGTIAQLEVSITPRGLKDLNAAAGHRFSSSSRSLNGTGHSSCEPGTPSGGATDEKSSRTTHTTLPLNKSRDDYDDDDEEDVGSCRSFTEEYHRREQKHKGVVRELKHMFGLEKLFRRSSNGAKLKRADGCLT